MRAQLEDLDVDSNAALGYLGKVLIAVWAKETPAMAGRFRRAAERGIQKHKTGLAHFVLQEPGLGLISQEARAGIMQAVKDIENSFDGYVVLLNGTGFFGAAFRAMVTGMTMMAPRLRSPIKVVGTMQEAERLLGQFTGGHAPLPTVAALEQAVESMRAKMMSASEGARGSKPNERRL